MMEAELLQSWEIQKEGAEEISSDSDSDCYGEILDIYGRPEIDEDDNNSELKNSIIESLRNKETRYQIIFHRWVLVVFCLFVPIICTITVMVAIKQIQKYGLECIFAGDGIGWFLIPMVLLFFFDMLFLISGIIYHLNVHNYYCCCYRLKWIHRNDPDLGHEGVVEIEPDHEGA
eukprot:UN00168